MSGFIYLASASPRRRELLSQIGVDYRVHKVDVDERALPGESPEILAERLARAKAEAARQDLGCDEPVLGADTIVVLDGQVLSKPGDASRARQMLDRLSGRTHRVISAVALAYGGRTIVRLNQSEVRFREIGRGEAEAYANSPEPLDKAGAYAIQGFGAVFVEQLHGSYSGVMGLPLCETWQMLRSTGLLE